jgi:hypothetical protein
MSDNKHRRRDHRLAERVQYGLSLLYTAGGSNARQYMTSEGITVQTIERVLAAKCVRGARMPIRIV